MARIICLANSEKLSGRCIAGIDIDTGKWIRPVSPKSDTIYNERFINGKWGNEPRLLDLIEIPLVGQAPDQGCQPENRYLDKGQWNLIRRLSVSGVTQFIDNTGILLHSQDNKVGPQIFNKLPRNKWKSLQLIHVTNPRFKLNPWKSHGHPICDFVYSGAIYTLKITDPLIISKIKKSKDISTKCLFTVSMTTPYPSPAYKIIYCWKLIAGVIEL